MGTMAELSQGALGTLNELVPSAQRIGLCAFGPAVFAKPDSYKGLDVLLVCDGYTYGLRSHLKILDDHEVRFLISDRNLLESDIAKGTLGDFLTEKLLYPYRSLDNADYFARIGIQAKMRIVREETRDLVVEYGEMCRGVVAKPEFFGLSRMRKRARAFLPSLADYLRLLDPSVREQNLSLLRKSYMNAIATMNGDIVELDGDYVNFQDDAVDRWLNARASGQAINILRQSQRTFYSYLTKGRSIYLNLDLITRELSEPLRTGFEQLIVGRRPENPKDYLFFRTSEEFVPFEEIESLEDIITKLKPGRPVTISPLAGALNEVFLVTAGKDLFVAKKFTDWHGFKWFTLNLVSFGSKVFSVSGKTRMTKEYGVNRYLAKKGLKVPQIIHVNLRQKILIEKFISGTVMSDFVRQAVNQSNLSDSQIRLSEAFGDNLARIHGIGVSVGDSKPENFVAKDGEIFTVDLEQAGKRGDYAWDIAELLFYAGHYSSSPAPTHGLKELTHAFTRGYLRHGQPTQLRQAAGLRYAKVFSLWTSAPIILQISKILHNAGGTT